MSSELSVADLVPF